MELGNIIFGNSRGEYDITGNDFITDKIYELLLYCNKLIEGEFYVDYENDTFFTMPYVWDGCSCGFDNIAEEWHRKHDHEPTCYQSLVKKELIEKGWKEDSTGYLNPPKDYDYPTAKDIEDEVRKKYCKKFNLSFPYGCAVHCTCSYKKLEEEYYNTHDHNPYCRVVMPNFFYKPTGLSIQWYKYPGRDSYSNKKITNEEFLEIINKCKKSVDRDREELYKYIIPLGKYKNINIGTVIKLEEGRKYLLWIATLNDKNLQAKYHISNNLITIVKELIGIKKGDMFKEMEKVENEAKRN